MRFKESLKAYGTKHFDEILESELDQLQYDLPLDQACLSGGAPDDIQEIRISNVDDDSTHIHASIRIDFAEILSPFCKDTIVKEPRVFCGRLTISKRDGSGHLEALEQEPWDQY